MQLPRRTTPRPVLDHSTTRDRTAHPPRPPPDRRTNRTRPTQLTPNATRADRAPGRHSHRPQSPHAGRVFPIPTPADPDAFAPSRFSVLSRHLSSLDKTEKREILGAIGVANLTREPPQQARNNPQANPPSTARLTLLIPRFSNKRTEASTTSPMVTNLPVGVCDRTPSSTASAPAQ
jgi:hypothetical protein